MTYDTYYRIPKERRIRFPSNKEIDSIINSCIKDATAPRLNASTPRVEAIVTPRVEEENESAPRVNTAKGPTSNTRTTARRRAVDNCANILAKELNSQIEDTKPIITIKGVQELVNSVMDLETRKF